MTFRNAIQLKRKGNCFRHFPTKKSDFFVRVKKMTFCNLFEFGNVFEDE